MTPVFVDAALLSHPLAVRSLRLENPRVPVLAVLPRALWADPDAPMVTAWEKVLPPQRLLVRGDSQPTAERVVEWLLPRAKSERITGVVVITATREDDEALLQLPYPALAVTASLWAPLGDAVDDAVRALDALSVVR